eukprot:Platyproteum_vivax@DN4047_c0_g1_i1.p1
MAKIKAKISEMLKPEEAEEDTQPPPKKRRIQLKPSLRLSYESPSKGVYFVPSRGNWQVIYHTGMKQRIKCFSARFYGFDVAKRMALAFKKRFNPEGVTGVKRHYAQPEGVPAGFCMYGSQRTLPTECSQALGVFETAGLSPMMNHLVKLALADWTELSVADTFTAIDGVLWGSRCLQPTAWMLHLPHKNHLAKLSFELIDLAKQLKEVCTRRLPEGVTAQTNTGGSSKHCKNTARTGGRSKRMWALGQRPKPKPTHKNTSRN